MCVKYRVRLIVLRSKCNVFLPSHLYPPPSLLLLSIFKCAFSHLSNSIRIRRNKYTSNKHVQSETTRKVCLEETKTTTTAKIAEKRWIKSSLLYENTQRTLTNKHFTLNHLIYAWAKAHASSFCFRLALKCFFFVYVYFLGYFLPACVCVCVSYSVDSDRNWKCTRVKPAER